MAPPPLDQLHSTWAWARARAQFNSLAGPQVALLLFGAKSIAAAVAAAAPAGVCHMAYA